MSEDDILEFTKRTGLSIFEASAKTGSGVESSFIALTDALIEHSKKDQSKKKTSDSAKRNSSASQANNKNPYLDGDESDPPFDDSRIKMKRINGRDLGLSRTDKAMMLCC